MPSSKPSKKERREAKAQAKAERKRQNASTNPQSEISKLLQQDAASNESTRQSFVESEGRLLTLDPRTTLQSTIDALAANQQRQLMANTGMDPSKIESDADTSRKASYAVAKTELGFKDADDDPQASESAKQEETEEASAESGTLTTLFQQHDMWRQQVQKLKDEMEPPKLD